MTVSLSTANNTESDNEMTSIVFLGGASGTLIPLTTTLKNKIISLATKTTYYLNAKTGFATAASVNFGGAECVTVIRAVCAYL